MLTEFDQNTIANMTAALDYVCKKVPADKDSTELRKRIADELMQCARSGKRSVIDLQNAGLNVLKATTKPTGFNWFGLRRFYSRWSSGLMWFRIIVGLRAGAEGEGEMSDNDSPAASRDPHVDFDAPAILRKWPSLNNQRRTDVVGPYLPLESTLDECLLEFMAKPAPMRHLYQVHT